MFLKIFLILLSCLFAYIFGSFNFAIIITRKFYKKNIKNLGSKNAGMTNVLRNFGKTPAIFTFIGDFLKGILAILFCHIICFKIFSCVGLIYLKYFVMLFALLGHIFPFLYKFKGGKGIAVVAGAISFLDIKIFLTVFTVFIIVFKCSKIVSLSSISAALIYPIATFLVNHFNNKISTITTILETVFATMISIVLIISHKNNLKRLLEKKEPKIGK